jgi:hypothetical protein
MLGSWGVTLEVPGAAAWEPVLPECILAADARACESLFLSKSLVALASKQTFDNAVANQIIIEVSQRVDGDNRAFSFKIT